MRSREFAYADVYRHPPVEGAAFLKSGLIKPDIPPEIATLCKNESNCTVFLEDGGWLTTWGQGTHEGHKDQRIVFSISRDEGKTWSEPGLVRQGAPYGIPFVVPKTGRIYVFFTEKGPDDALSDECFVYSDDLGATWTEPRWIDLHWCDGEPIPAKLPAGWLNHPPQFMPTGEVVFCNSCGPFHRVYARARGFDLTPPRLPFQLIVAESNVIRCDNILEETDPAKLHFTLLPESPRGIRANCMAHLDNPSMNRLFQVFNGAVEDSGWSFQEMTIVPMSGDRWLGIGRTPLGAPGYTVSADRGRTWPRAEPLQYRPGGPPIDHPMTMCPMAKTSDGRYVLLFTNNDGTKRGAAHVWDGEGRTRNPQWFVVGVEKPGETENAGLVFGEPKVLVEVEDGDEQANLKTGISMPQFFERNGRYFVCYNINKEHILLDEIPAPVLDEMTPHV